MRSIFALALITWLISTGIVAAQEQPRRDEHDRNCTTIDGQLVCRSSGHHRHGYNPSSTGEGGYNGVLASRTFAQPHDIPPVLYRAYGIVAFPALATRDTQARFLAVCSAYLATLPASSEVNADLRNQMVTVWPVKSAEIVERISALDPDAACREATENYSLTTSLTALREARLAGVRHLDGRGPYLLAWSPASAKGQRRTLVLVLDLSSAGTNERLRENFSVWRDKIEQDPTLWENGFSVAGLRDKIRYWVDNIGNQLLSTNADAP